MGTGREPERGRRREIERKTGREAGAGTERRVASETRTDTGAGTGLEWRREREQERRGKGGSRRDLVSATSGKKHNRRPGTAIPTRYHLCRQEVAPADSQQLRTQDPAPVRRCGTEGRTGH